MLRCTTTKVDAPLERPPFSTAGIKMPKKLSTSTIMSLLMVSVWTLGENQKASVSVVGTI